MSYPYLKLLLVVLVVGAVIGGIVALIRAMTKNAKSQGGGSYSAPAATPYTPTSSDSPSSSSGGTSTIFINGGAPSSGNVMGKISVDGRSLSILYTEAPLEIAISAGRHHVIVEGGLYGDARIDRAIDFGALDVWTVDMPGADDADVIRHQMIGYADYCRALSDAGYRVTKKRL